MLGAILGGLGGALGGLFGSQSSGGTDAGNVYADPRRMEEAKKLYDNALKSISTDQWTDRQAGSQLAAQEIQKNPLLSSLFGQDGTLNRTAKEEQNLASRGFSLQPEDYEAYGQASGDIARMFDQSDQSLASALAARGLSDSGVAASQFAGAQGNKREQLAAMQRKVADDRMKMNLERLGQTRNFLSQMGGQAQNALQDQFNRQVTGKELANQAYAQQANLSKGWIDSFQNQANANQQQRQDSARPSAIGGALMGGLGGALGGGRLQAALEAGRQPSVQQNPGIFDTTSAPRYIG